MKIEKTVPEIDVSYVRERLANVFRLRTWWLLQRLVVVTMALLLLGSSSIPYRLARHYHFQLSVAGRTWDLLGWEAGAIKDKLTALFEQPADELGPVEATEVVEQYLARAARMGEIERDVAQRAILPIDLSSSPSAADLLSELAALRALQEEVRSQVEQVIERQVAGELEQAGFLWLGRPFPPVSFTFVEPPKKMVVSSRDQIDTIYSQMLEAAISPAEIEQVEAEIREQYNAVGYITDIGGLGAFPTMVVDRASLRWVLSTVAHEWTHNYQVFYPLGWNYFASQDLTTMNETVAEIVGNEIGDLTLARYYPDQVPSSLPVSPPASPPESPEPLPFDFQLEMRLTRLEVDRLLAEGDVGGAEAYMESRRQEFVRNGYPLRVLNQAYFAFHGSYGTSPASTSPIGPKMERLRALMPDIKTFLETVHAFTSVEDLDQALGEWEARANPAMLQK